MGKKELKKLAVDEFGGEYAQKLYKRKVEDGLWKSEKELIAKYFKRRGNLLELRS